MAGARRRDRDPEVLVRERRAVELRLEGLSYDAISDELGLGNRGSAYRLVFRALTAERAEAADELRTVEVARLERLHAAWWPRALQGDAKAAQVILRVSERRAKLLGLDAPQQHRVDATVEGALDAEIESLLAQLTEAAQPPPVPEDRPLRLS